MEKIIFEYEFDNWNDTINKSRSNYYYANKKKRQEMEYIKWELIRQKINPIEKYPISLNCYWYCKTRNSDLDNKSIKPILDQMQKSNILKNDNLTCITEIHHYYVKSDKIKLEIEIKEV